MSDFVIRAFEAKDTAFIVDSWRNSGFKPFLEGKYQPFKGFEETIRLAIRVGNIKLLKRIYHSEIGRIMNHELAKGEVLVLCDVDDSNIIFGWKCDSYRYIKQIVRGLTGDF